MKIFCIGRNYREHADELKNDRPSEPLFFLKPESALLEGGGSFPYPSFSSEVHFETELVLRMGRDGASIDPDRAELYVEGVGIGFDMTARDLQKTLKEKGHPWEKAKAFDRSAPVSEHFLPLSDIPDLSNLDFSCEKNGERVQEGNSGEMIFPFPTLIAHISRYISFKKGDLLFTGTPAGVGPVEVGDRLEAFIGRRSLLTLRIDR
jgi:2-keto-4-pentenoate hydratase/2-oxohepta-3-ene-1,7-dioic acid hydratase in catechol pathway